MVFGATGNVGQHVVAEALRRGHEIVGIVRDPSAVQSAHKHVRLVKGDATNADDVATVAYKGTMIHPARYALLPAMVLLAVGGCRDEKPQRAAPVSHASAVDRTQTDTAAGPADVIRRYYDAIGNGQYETAYRLWEGSGKASGQTRGEFVSGFAQTARTTSNVGGNVRVEGAAGSQYATVPVTVDAVLRGGTRQHFVGTYTLRRSMVDGATPEQRSWHIYSSHLQQH